ncbi:MAG: DUF4010 domain-containing protein [Acidobacteriota bacterium]
MDDTAFRTVGVLIAALGGAGVGVERQRSGHATGPLAHFGGVRTFALLGGLAGASGWLWATGATWLAAALLAGAVGIVLIGYYAAAPRSIDGTTEVAALVTLAAGVLAGTGYLAFASGIIALTVLLLAEKTRVHAIVDRMDDTAVRAGFRFAVMAIVILPLLPEGPFGPLGGIRPRELWVFVLFFSGLSFAAYLARLFVGARHGYLIAGLIGGLISSTSVTLTFARASRAEGEDAGRALAFGVIAACTMLFVRVLGATAVLYPPLAVALVPLLFLPFAAGAGVTLVGLRWRRPEQPDIQPHRNPLQIRAALEMAALFQLVLYGVGIVRRIWGDVGLVVSGTILGLADVDALMISMAKTAGAEGAAAVPALAIAVGILSNTALKFTLAAAIGRRPFRPIVAVGLAVQAATGAAALLAFR